MKKIWLFPCTIFLVLYFSCSKDDKLLSNQNLREIPLFLLTPEWPSSQTFYPPDNNKLKLTYKNNQLSRITGDFLPIPTASNIHYDFTDIIYWDIRIVADHVTLEKKSASEMMSFDEKHELTYQNNLIVERKLNRKDLPNRVYTYEYENNLLKKEYRYLDGKLSVEKIFYFNAKQNLDSIVSERPITSSKLVEIFSDYDKKTNKIKGLTVLEDFLPRALSKNNYLKKTTIFVSETGERSLSEERKWDAQLFN